MLIRQALKDDLPSIERIYRQLIAEPYLSKLDYWETLLASQGLLVAEAEGAVIGFGTIEVEAREQIKQLYVSPAYQGRGVGAKILARLEEIARGRGVSFLSLHAAPAAVAFYRRAGYTPMESASEGHHDHEGVMMSKELHLSP